MRLRKVRISTRDCGTCYPSLSGSGIDNGYKRYGFQPASHRFTMRAFVFVAAISLAYGLPLEAPKNFTNFKLVSAKVPSAELFAVAEKLHSEGRLELWSDLPGKDGSILFSVAPNDFEAVEA